MLLLCTVLLPLQVQADGLRPGERFQEIAPAPTETDADLPDHGLRYGRVVDAFTGLPIQGATVELWTEEIDALHHGFFRVGEARTGIDGHYAVKSYSGSARGEKMRLMAPGYLTRSTTPHDVNIELFPIGEEPFQLRVLDTSGRPIAGACVTSTLSCSHDVPAFEVRTDALGVARCFEFGLQDEIPELRLRARGHAAIEYLDSDDALLTPGQPKTVYLPRREPTAVRIVYGEDAAPLADTAIYVIDDECYHVERTDKEGVLRLDTRYGNGELGIYVLQAPQNRHIAHCIPLSERTITLRPGGNDWPEDLPLGRIVVERGGQPIDVYLHHEDGWADSFSRGDEPREFPAGKGFVLIGGPFLGYEREILEFDLEPGRELRLKPKLVREPSVTFVAPEGFDGKLWIEAGNDSLEDVEPSEAVSVPAGRRMVVFTEEDGRYARLVVDRVRDGMQIDLTSREALGPKQPVSIGEGTQRVRFVDASGAPIRGEFSLQTRRCVVEPSDDKQHSEVTVRGPIGTSWLGSFRAKGFVNVWVRGRVERQSSAIRKVISRTASLEVRADFEYELVGCDLESLERLPPGPLHLVVESEDEQRRRRRYALQLEMVAGEKRVLKLEEE